MKILQFSACCISLLLLAFLSAGHAARSSTYDPRRRVLQSLKLDCHVSCQQCYYKDFLFCASCPQNRRMRVVNEKLGFGSCECIDGYIEDFSPNCKSSSNRSEILRSLKALMYIAMFLAAAFALLSSSIIPFLTTFTGLQSLSLLIYVNHVNPMLVDNVLKIVSLCQLNTLIPNPSFGHRLIGTFE